MTENTIAKGKQDKQWQTIQWIKENRTNNDRQYNGKRTTGKTMTENAIAEGKQEKQWQTMQWLKDNRKNNDRQYNG
jgi:hypothetical protein